MPHMTSYSNINPSVKVFVSIHRTLNSAFSVLATTSKFDDFVL